MAITIRQYNAAKVSVLAATGGAVAIMATDPKPGTALMFAGCALLGYVGDLVSAWVRHRGNTRFLDWSSKNFAGRFWHVPVVLLGLACTFAKLKQLEPFIEGFKVLLNLSHTYGGATNDVSARLFLGIEPMAVVSGIDAGVKEGRKSGLQAGVKAGLKTFGVQTAMNATSSAFAGEFTIPAHDGAVYHFFGDLKGTVGAGLAAVSHYVFGGYVPVLAARGYADTQGSPEVQAEIAAGKAEAALLAKVEVAKAAKHT